MREFMAKSTVLGDRVSKKKTGNILLSALIQQTHHKSDVIPYFFTSL